MKEPHLRDAGQLLQAVTAKSLAGLDLAPADAAAVRLAVEYAEAIDLCYGNPDTLKSLGPPLLAVLESLGATPLGRSKAKGTGPEKPQPGRLAAIRAASG